VAAVAGNYLRQSICGSLLPERAGNPSRAPGGFVVFGRGAGGGRTTRATSVSATRRGSRRERFFVQRAPAALRRQGDLVRPVAIAGAQVRLNRTVPFQDLWKGDREQIRARSLSLALDAGGSTGLGWLRLRAVATARTTASTVSQRLLHFSSLPRFYASVKAQNDTNPYYSATKVSLYHVFRELT
jgi:hypothetical protein